MCAFITHAAASVGYAAVSATEFAGFKASLTAETSVVVLDLMMPGIDRIQVLRYLSDQRYLAEVILISGYDKKVLNVAAQLAKTLGLNVRASIQKPIKLDELREILAKPRPMDGKQNLPAVTGDRPFADQKSVQQAITDDQLLVHYQPQFEIRTRKLTGVEALVRWHHPRRALLPAAAFIETFEASGLIDELTWIVVGKILTDRKKW